MSHLSYQTIIDAMHYAFSGWRVKLLTTLLILFTGFIIWQTASGNRELFSNTDWQFTPYWLGPALGFILLQLYLGGLGWHILVQRLTQFNSTRYNLKVWWATNLSRRIPGGIWYIANRAIMYDHSNQGGIKRAISAASGLELVFILISGALIALISLPFWVIASQNIFNAYTWLFLILIPVGIALIHPQVITWLWQKLTQNKRPPLHLAWHETSTIISYYGLIWILAGFMAYSTINFVHPLTPSYLPTLIGMWALSSIVATVGGFMVGGFGIRELSLAFLLSQIIPLPVAILVVVLLRILWLIGEIITGLISLFL